MKRAVAVAALALVAAIAGEARAVTLDDYLAAVRRNHPLFAREAMEAAIDSVRAEGIRGREDWVVTSSPRLSWSEPVQTTPFVPERVTTLDVGAAVGRTFWSNGSRVSLAWTSEVLDERIPGFVVPGPTGPFEVPVGPARFTTHTLAATWSLPLWANRGGTLDRLDYTLARYDVDVAAIASRERREDFLLDVAVHFVDWALVGEQVRIAEGRLALAEEELERTRRKRASHLVDEADVLRAADAVHVARSGHLQALSRWRSARAELAVLAGWDEAQLDAPTLDLYDEPPAPADSALAGDVAGTRVVRQIDLQHRRLVAAEAGATAAARPNLSLNVTGALVGGSDAFDRSLELTHPDVAVGLEFRYPLGNRSANAALEATRLQRRQLELARSEAVVQLTSAGRALVVQMRQLDAVLGEDRARIETSRRKTQEELALYDQGRGDLTFVIQSRDNEALAKLAYAGDAALYQELALRYRALVDRLLPVESGR